MVRAVSSLAWNDALNVLQIWMKMRMVEHESHPAVVDSANVIRVCFHETDPTTGDLTAEVLQNQQMHG